MSHSVTTSGKAGTVTLCITDELSAIAELSYTLDSNDEWKQALPEDSVYDTTSENFTIVVKKLDAGEHVIALKIADAVGNTVYKTFDIIIK